MDNADEITNLLAQITREEAALTKFSMVKETLQNEVEAKKGELQIAQGVKRKQQVEYTETNKAQKKDIIQIHIVQVCPSTCPMEQTWHRQVHQPETICL